MSILYGTKINQLLANIAPTGLLFADSYMDLYYVMERPPCVLMLYGKSR